MGHITAMFASEVWGMNLLTATISQVGSIANRKSSERFENHWRSKYFIPEIRCSIWENANYHDGNGIFVILFYLILPLFDCIIISFCAFFSDMSVLTLNTDLSLTVFLTAFHPLGRFINSQTLSQRGSISFSFAL